MRHDRIQFRQLIAVGFDEGQFVRSDIVFQINWLVLRHGGEFSDALAHFFGIHMQTVSNDVRVRQ